uniref:Uncharacterized protein n=1 Tax=Bionectria ochroleuca TaxID=29856 RepID=A0A8H7K4S6_BIOOC
MCPHDGTKTLATIQASEHDDGSTLGRRQVAYLTWQWPSLVLVSSAVCSRSSQQKVALCINTREGPSLLHRGIVCVNKAFRLLSFSLSPPRSRSLHCPVALMCLSFHSFIHSPFIHLFIILL